MSGPPMVPWALRRRRSAPVTSLVAALVLVIAGALVGGFVGWASVAFFGFASLVLVRQILAAKAVVVVDGDGITVAGWREGQPQRSTPWSDLEGLILWTRGVEHGGRMDLLSVVRREPGAGWGLEELVENSVPLVDCTLDAEELRRAIARHVDDVTVVDQRT